MILGSPVLRFVLGFQIVVAVRNGFLGPEDSIFEQQ